MNSKKNLKRGYAMKKILQGLSASLLVVALVAMPLSVVASEGVDTEMVMPTEEQMAEMAQFFEMQLATFSPEKQKELQDKLDKIEELSDQEGQALVEEIMAGGNATPVVEEIEVEVQEPVGTDEEATEETVEETDEDTTE